MGEFFAKLGLQLTAAHNGPDGLREALSGKHDLVLLDVMMPGFDGFEVLRRLRAESDIPVLMLTARAEALSRILGLESGADDYLPKPFDPLELVARIKAILRRSRPHKPPAVLQIGGVTLDTGSRRVTVGGKEIDVTTIEYDILETLMLSAGRVVSRDELMQRLYQRQATPFDRSIDVHVSHLRKKLEGTRDLIRTVRGVGYLFAAQMEATG
ncbi:MAG: response regulator transcription factor [Bryobacteraceae bacterium]|nr:response regulator transcription factor [Bryobacteraceae bacterium]